MGRYVRLAEEASLGSDLQAGLHSFMCLGHPMVIYDIQGQPGSAGWPGLLCASWRRLEIGQGGFCHLYLRSFPMEPSFILLAPKALVSKSPIKCFGLFLAVKHLDIPSPIYLMTHQLGGSH